MLNRTAACRQIKLLWWQTESAHNNQDLLTSIQIFVKRPSNTELCSFYNHRVEFETCKYLLTWQISHWSYFKWANLSNL